MSTELQRKVLQSWKNKGINESMTEIAWKIGCSKSIVSKVVKKHKLYHYLDLLLEIVLNSGKTVEDFTRDEMEALNAINALKDDLVFFK